MNFIKFNFIYFCNNFKDKNVNINQMTVTETYPIFLRCCEFTEDEFWKNIFEDLAYGKAPHGTYISKNFLCCSYKEKNFNYKIEDDKDPEEIYEDIYDLLKNKLGLLSQKQKEIKREKFENIEYTRKESRKTWKKIRKKTTKQFMIQIYVAQMKTKYNLTIKQSKKLLSDIFISIALQLITPENINYSNGKINSIDGIEFENEKVLFSFDLNDAKCKKSNSKTKTSKKSIVTLWDNYIKNLQKIKNTI